MKKMTQKRLVRHSARATENLVSQIGGKKTPASGAWLEKADGRVQGLFRIETKAPPTGRYRLTLEDWNTIWRIAVMANEIAVFHLKLASDVEIVLMRDVDYRGCNGASVKVGNTEPTLKGWTITAKEWAKLESLCAHRFVALGKVLLRAMPARDFVKLANQYKELMGC